MSTQIKDLEALIKTEREAVDLAVSLDRLTRNRDFIRIIEKGYFEQAAINLVMLKAEFTKQSPEDQADIIKRIDAIGELRNYFRVINAKSVAAENRIREAQASIEYLQANPEDGEFEDGAEVDDAYTA